MDNNETTTRVVSDLERTLEAILMVADEPQSLVSLATSLGSPVPAVRQSVERLVADFNGESGAVRRGFELRELLDVRLDAVGDSVQDRGPRDRTERRPPGKRGPGGSDRSVRLDAATAMDSGDLGPVNGADARERVSRGDSLAADPVPGVNRDTRHLRDRHGYPSRVPESHPESGTSKFVWTLTDIVPHVTLFAPSTGGQVHRPRIAVLGRFTESASVLRSRGVVSSRALLDLVWAAGGDPVTMLPGSEPDALDWASRLVGVEGVLLPGGGDVDPARYGGDVANEAVYGVDEVQDDADFSLARHCLTTAVPMLAVCRGLHVVNVVRGGSLIVDMPQHHRHTRQQLTIDPSGDVLGLGPGAIEISCYHHQAVDRLGEGVTAVARADDGTVEAVVVDAAAWTVGVQWHPEDTWRDDGQQVNLVRTLVEHVL